MAQPQGRASASRNVPWKKSSASLHSTLALEEEKKNQKLGDEASTASSSTSATRIEPAAPYSEKPGITAPLDAKPDNMDQPQALPDSADQATAEPMPLPGGNDDAEKTPESPEDQPLSPEETRTKLQTTLIIISLASALFLAALDVTIVTVAVPTIAEEFNSPAGYTWIGSAYLLANAAAAPMWGKISDIWGRKPIILCATAVFWVGSLLSAVSVNMAMLIAARAIQGIGGGGIVILVNICISDMFSMRRRGVYFGIMGLSWAVAGGIGPIIGGVFTTKVTWRCVEREAPQTSQDTVVMSPA